MGMKKILSIVLTMVLLASAVSLAITPAAAYEKKISGDADENDELTKEELVNAILPYMLGEGTFKLDDVGDAAYIYAYWGGEPKTVIDQADRMVRLYRPLERIVATNPDNSRVLIALGACDKLVGVSNSAKRGICVGCEYGKKETEYTVEGCKSAKRLAANLCGGRFVKLPDVTTRNIETFVFLEPDVVFVRNRASEYAVQDHTCIPTVYIDMNGHDFEKLCDGVEFMGALVGKENEAEELISFIEGKVGKVRQVTEEIPNKKTVYFASRGATIGSIAGGATTVSFTTTAKNYKPLDIAGGINVAEECIGEGAVDVSTEQVIKWNPDVILVAQNFPAGVDHLGIIIEDPLLYSITAVKTESVYYCLYPYYCGTPSDKNLANMMYIAKLLYPDKFEDLDLEKEGNEIFEAFLRVDGLFSEYADYTVWLREFLDEQQKS